VNFFSGFSLCNEEKLFEAYLKKSLYSVSGFSLGAVRAFEYVQNSSDRIDTLQLFSPAFFQEKSEKFRRLQTISYQKNQEAYEKQFLENIAYPSTCDMTSYFKKDTLSSLQKLLEFTWEPSALTVLKRRGIHVEVYLGGEDKIIDTKKAYDFFKNYATVYFIKEGGHILYPS
jgi:predicted alpha/beta hydrolase family esterase